MNITEIQLRTPGVDYIHAQFLVEDPSSSDRYILKGSTGLDAEEIVPKISGRANGTTVDFHEMTLKPRVVALLLKLNPNYTEEQTVGDLRDILYRSIAATRQGKLELRFLNEETNLASLYGMITKVETSIFSPESEVKITMECDDPFLRSNDSVVILTPDLAVPSPTWTDNVSTAPHGYKLDIQFTSPVTNLVVRGIDSPNYAPFTINYSFLTDDTLYISSDYEDQYIYVLRDEDEIHLTDKIAGGSIWPVMLPGVTTIGLSSALAVVVQVAYRHAYWGV